MKRLLLSAIFSALASLVFAQSAADWREIYERMFPADEEETEALSEEEMERLDEIAANPLNINTITQEQLEELPFLSDEEVNAIGLYLYRYDGMMTLNELASIPQLSLEKRQLLRHFLYCGEKEKRNKLTLGNILKYGKQELFYSGRIPLYERKGDVTKPEDGGYLGIPYKQQLRYSYNYANRLKAGLVGANDSGEQFFAGRNGAGFDYYSFYVQLKGIRLSKSLNISNICIGNYRAGFGMGLVINNSATLWKQTMMSSAGRMTTGFRPHSSSSDGKYLQGVAVTFTGNSRQTQGNRLQTAVSLFASSRHINATVNADTISSILSSGYHRTQNEMDKKNAATQSVVGADLSLKRKRLSVGMTAVYSHLNLPLIPDKSVAYRRYSAEGKDFITAGINYAYSSPHITFKGELAGSPASQADSLSDGLALSTINMLTISPSYGLSFSLLHRYYSREYTTLLGRSFAEDKSIQDEHGLFAAVNWSPSSTWAIRYYADYAHFHNPKYLVSTSSNMVENTLLLTWSKDDWTVSLRGRMKSRQYDSADKQWLVWKNNASLRLQTEYLGTRLTLQYSHYDKDTNKSNGLLAMLSAAFSPWKSLTTGANVGYFNTDDYYSAIYAYERGMSYNMNSLQLYGEGVRLSLLLNANVSQRLAASLKFGATKYFDRHLIGTAMEEIQSTIKADIDFQLRWKI